ncbi:exocyst complex component, exo70 subunit [Collybia nuda]|uniref:Exocyst complex protein EXO70 n=1 Tax=Collybia nuda TaxID=64659 RepID=A0A9P5Y113_9AGAR|nr:exocyst complex component, exo70 subunit [Collybia nuda]
MDDETAEIELLEQNLNKTRQISKRMISILDSFDTRLAKLEKSILPLYTSTQILNRRASNIDKTLIKIDEVASNQEGIAAEEALILRGPQTGQLEKYKEALERLNASIAFKSSEVDSDDTARLVETGAKKLTQLYTKLVAEVSSGSTPAPGAEWAMSPFPPALLSTLRQLVSFLRTLPLPTTHPSHPAAPAILSTLKDAQRGYADMRGVWAQKCLESQGKRVIGRADTIDPIAAGKEFGKWVETVLTVSEDEYQLLAQLTPMSNPSLLESSFRTLMTPILALFGTTLSSLVALIKKSLHKYNFLALSAYESLLNHQAQWDDLLGRRGSETRKDTNEVKDGLHTLRSVCLRSFPEFLADLKFGAMGKGGELVTTSLADFAISTIKYMENLPQVRAAVGSALVSLGDGNWKMGEGVQVGKAAKVEENDESVVLEHFVYDVVTTAINSLNTLSRTSRRPAIASIFLLNNISYLRHHLILDPAHPDLSSLLSQPAQDALNSNFRTAKAAYFDSNFSPLMQALTDDPKEKTNKAATKEKFTRFFDLLEEVKERHKLAKVMEDDAEGRETIGDEVVKLVIPSLQRFTQKHRDKEFSKNPQKYIKMSADVVETQLKGIFR